MVAARILSGVAITLSLVLTSASVAQTSRILPWNDGVLDDSSISVDAYHPEPIILGHGTSGSRVRWENVINYLHGEDWFQAYHYSSNLVMSAKESNFNTNQQDYADAELPSDQNVLPELQVRNQWRDIEQPYIHTWNYGRHAKRGPLPNLTSTTHPQISRQSNDPIEWNSWQIPI